MTDSFEPKSCFYESQGLRLHYVDWGNEAAPALVLLHGGRDHCRTWDWVARALRPHFHIMAADLRGHGDSEWPKGSSYSMADHVYDLTRMAAAVGLKQMSIVGHSFGGMISTVYAGAFPAHVKQLAVLDGAFNPRSSTLPIEQQFVRWAAELNRTSAMVPRRYSSIEEAAARMTERNTRLTPELAMHLARHAVKQNADGTYIWKYDPTQRVNPPYKLTVDDLIALRQRITCPTLLLRAGDSIAPDPASNGILSHFKHAEQKVIAGAGHWVHHDKLDVVVAELRALLGVGG
jgi:pimeloyl-ACP methyl ester carboxylesterase